MYVIIDSKEKKTECSSQIKKIIKIIIKWFDSDSYREYKWKVMIAKVNCFSRSKKLKCALEKKRKQWNREKNQIYQVPSASLWLIQQDATQDV